MNFGTIGQRIGRDTLQALQNIATRTIVRKYQHEADHNEALKMDAAYSTTIGRVIRPIPNEHSLYYVKSDRNPSQHPCHLQPAHETRVVVQSNMDAYVAVNCKLDGVRSITSGGQRDRSAHLAYQKAYQAKRETFGAKMPSGRTVRYTTRARADKARETVRAFVASKAVR